MSVGPFQILVIALVLLAISFVTVGAINGGVRHNIIPDTVEMLGTIRTFSEASRHDVIERMKRIASNVAEANGATATIELAPAPNPPVSGREPNSDL